jgi:hypothetical protein
MRINVKALAIALGIIWGAAVFLVASVNLFWPNYGAQLLELLASIYPGYKGTSTFASVITVTLYSIVDAALLGVVLGWLYNRIARVSSPPRDQGN